MSLVIVRLVLLGILILGAFGTILNIPGGGCP